MTLLEFVDGIARNALQHPDIYLQGGHNGPYFHPETALRNKGHWLITFCKLYQWTGKDAYKQKAAEIAEYLLSAEARPFGYSFFHRRAPKKDQCNGLIGQAWTFEALAQAAETFQDASFTNLAEEVFLQHHFNKKYAMWNILEVDGKILYIDNAFNHQLWFAAGISLIKSEHAIIRQRIKSFLDKLFDHVTILEDGLIYHEFDFDMEEPYARRRKIGVKRIIRQHLMNFLPSRSKNEDLLILSPEEKKMVFWEEMKHKSIGYHAFNTYAFALLKQQYPEHFIWKDPSFLKIVDYLLTDEYKQGVEDNAFSFAYNPPGFEVPFSVHVLLSLEQEQFSFFAREWVKRQISLTYNKDNMIFDRNNQDSLTLTARLYEVTRLEAFVLEKIVL